MGYVEDDETPEAIMKKFEALERVQKQHAGRPASDEDMQAAEAPEAGGDRAQGEQVLTEEVLLEVFKQTSAFNVKTVQHNGVSALSLTGRPELKTLPGRGAVQRVPVSPKVAAPVTRLQPTTTTTRPSTARTSGASRRHG